MSIGSTIRMLRLAKGWRQEDLANRLNTSQSRISAIETDAYQERHTLKMLAGLASALDAELIVKFKVKSNGNSGETETLGQLQPQGNERLGESGAIDRSANAAL